MWLVSLKRNYLQFYPALISSSDTLSVGQSKWNELGQTGVSPTNCAKQRKVAICSLLPQEPAPNDDDWAAAKFPPFWPLFAAIPSTLILTLPPACLWDPTTERKVIRRQSFLLLLLSFPLLTNLIHCFSVFSSILVAALSYLSPWIATSSKNSISFRKWKLHHLRRVSIKLEGRRNGNVKIENLGREIRNTRGKNSFQMAKGNLSVDERFSSVRRYWCGERVAGGVAPCGRLLKNSLTTVIGSPYPPRPSIPLPLHPPPSSPQYSLKI